MLTCSKDSERQGRVINDVSYNVFVFSGDSFGTEGGNVNTMQGTFNVDTEVEFIATPKQGWVFSGWTPYEETSGNALNNGWSSSENPLIITFEI